MSRRRSCCLLPLAALALALAVPAALADGDPASDYLLSGPSFLSPYDGHIPAAEQARDQRDARERQGEGLPAPARRDRHPLRPRLGADPLRQAQIYAKFLGEEDYYYWKDELLVVMPNGYGIYKASDLPAADKAAIAALPKLDTRSGPALGLAAETALRALAAKHNITLSASGRRLGRLLDLDGARRDRRRGARPLPARRSPAGLSGGGGATPDRGAARPRLISARYR